MHCYQAVVLNSCFLYECVKRQGKVCLRSDVQVSVPYIGKITMTVEWLDGEAIALHADNSAPRDGLVRVGLSFPCNACDGILL